MFKKTFKFHDYEKTGALDMDETRLFFLHEKSERPDSLPFDEIDFMEYFAANSTDDKIPKAALYATILHRAKALGYVYE